MRLFEIRMQDIPSVYFLTIELVHRYIDIDIDIAIHCYINWLTQYSILEWRPC